MNITHRISAWGDRHHPKILDIIPMIFGAFLAFKGIVFFNDAGYLRDLILEKEAVNQPPGLITAIIYYVTYVHILGGGLIFIGLYTRLWALLELPILFGAVFLVNIAAPFVYSELWLAILSLALDCLFMIIGSGPLSLDRLLLKSNTFGEEK
jgi:putative oxidoreductase